MFKTSPNTTPSKSPPNATPSKFQPIFDKAVKAYEEKTKKDLRKHPFGDKLQSCKSPSDIIAVLQGEAEKLDRRMTNGKRLSSLLKPTINVLYVFSEMLGQAVALVSLNWSASSTTRLLKPIL